MYLNVHEGPISIANRISLDDPGIVENMVVSNEPGYYEPNKFGIRIESLVVTQKVDLKVFSLKTSYSSFYENKALWETKKKCLNYENRQALLAYIASLLI